MNVPMTPPEISTLPPAQDDLRHRSIRSFVRRAGRVTTGQEKALADLGPQFIVPYAPVASLAAAIQTDQAGHNTLDVNDPNLIANYSMDTPANGLFNAQENAPTVLEIGFGMGEATAHIAALMPGTRFVCCEVHPPGVGALLKRIAEQDLRNIRIVQHDAVEVLQNMIAPNSLDGVHIFFPDPWHKKRHNKRRLIQSPLVTLLASRIKPGGYLHCATDWQPYAEQILQVLGDEPSLANTVASSDASAGGYAPKPHYRPLTKFENRGIKLGHGVWDLVFRKKPLA